MPPSTGQSGAGDEARGVGGQEHDRVGHVGHLAEPAGRRQLDDRADRLLGRPEQAQRRDVVGQARAHRGRHQPGVDAVHADAVPELARLHRGDPGEPVDARLGGRVDRDARERDGRGHRRDVDDGAAAAGRAPRSHGAERVLDAERGAEQVDLELLAHLGRVEVDDQAGDLDACVVDDDVEPAGALDGGRDGSLPARVVGDVEMDRGVTVSERLGDLAGELVLDVGDDDGGARGGERLGHALAEALGATGHQRGPSGQVDRCHGVVSSRSDGGAVRVVTPWPTFLTTVKRISGHLSRTGKGVCQDACMSDNATVRARPGRQARRAAQPARRVGPADPGRARLRPGEPARDREQLRVQPRRRPLLLPRQARADRLLRALLQGAVRDPLRRGRRPRPRRPTACSRPSPPSWSRR